MALAGAMATSQQRRALASPSRQLAYDDGRGREADARAHKVATMRPAASFGARRFEYAHTIGDAFSTKARFADITASGPDEDACRVAAAAFYISTLHDNDVGALPLASGQTSKRHAGYYRSRPYTLSGHGRPAEAIHRDKP